MVDTANGGHDAAKSDANDRPVFEDGRLKADDATFAAMLGRPVPPPEGVRPFHLNSTLSELETTWLGRLVAKRFKARFAERMGGKDAATQKMIEQMAADMTLRSLVLFLGGRIPFSVAGSVRGRSERALSESPWSIRWSTLTALVQAV